MNRISFFCFCCCIFFLFSFQNPTIDSLKIELEQVSGEEKVKIYNELFKYLRSQEPDTALEYALEAYRMAESLGFKLGMANSLNNIGVSFRTRGVYDRALDYYFRALKIHQEIGNEEGVANGFSNIGTIYSIKQNYDRALEFFRDAKEIFSRFDDPFRVVLVLNNIGNVYFEQGDYGQALGNYLEAKRMLDSLQLDLGGFDLLNNIGNIYFQNGSYGEAKYYYEESLKIEKNNQNKYGEANALFNLGVLYKTEGNNSKALEYHVASRDLALSLGDKNLLKNIYRSFSEIYSRQRMYDMAFTYLMEHINVSNELFNEESTRKMTEFENALRFEQKERELERISQEATIIELENQNFRSLVVALIFVLSLVAALLAVMRRNNLQMKRSKKLVEKQNEEIRSRTKEIEEKKRIIEIKNLNITDSIRYAKSIQEALLNRNPLGQYLPESFVLFKPKDIVSGDFYWFDRKENCDILAVADCTGHGVAGSFMTVIGHSLLNRIINEENQVEPGMILSKLDKKLLETLKYQEMSVSDHGMDIAVCKIDHNKKKITFAGAKRPVYLVRNNELMEYKGSNQSIGESLLSKQDGFTEEVIDIQQGDVFYMFTDGFADQFGEAQNKKYMSKRFKDMLVNIHQQGMESQKATLQKDLKIWKGNLEQTDDILVIGFKLI